MGIRASEREIAEFMAKHGVDANRVWEEGFEQRATIRPHPDINEKDFQAMVIAYAELRGWKVYHTYISIRSKAGYPDLTMVRRNDVDAGRVVFAELKKETGKVEKAQSEWIKALEQAGQEVYLWRPSSWAEIVSVLR
jgi:hypothetical protein